MKANAESGLSFLSFLSRKPDTREARAKNPWIKSAFEEAAAGWLVLAEQMEWMDRQRSTDEENDRSLC